MSKSWLFLCRLVLLSILITTTLGCSSSEFQCGYRCCTDPQCMNHCGPEIKPPPGKCVENEQACGTADSNIEQQCCDGHCMNKICKKSEMRSGLSSMMAAHGNPRPQVMHPLGSDMEAQCVAVGQPCIKNVQGHICCKGHFCTNKKCV